MLSLIVALLVTAPQNVDIAENEPKLPKPFKASGKVMALATFKDSDGNHTAYVEQSSTKKGDLELHAYGYAGATKQWQANDFVRECELDQVLAYRAKSLAVTDLDNDGIAEVSFAYEQTCAGDVSPHTLKLLMYEGTTKYAVRGETIVDIGSGEKVDGGYELDPALKNAPAAFAEHLKARWAELIRI